MSRRIRPAARPVDQLLVVILTLITLLWTVISVSGCDRSKPSTVKQESVSEKKSPQVVTTTGMVRDMVSAMLGPDANVHAIMGPGIDPHLYQPNRGDSVKLLEADVVVYNGLHLEGRLGELLERRSGSGGVTIAVGELLDAGKLLDADAGTHDPHIWMDVSLWNEAAGLLAEELASALPDQADAIGQRSDAYQKELAELDRWAADAIDTIPPSQRILVTAHDAFRYFGKRYGIEVHGVQGVSTESKAGIKDINDLVDLIVERKVPAVFFESSVSPRQVEVIVEGAHQRGVTVSSDWELFSDSMGADDTPEGTYMGMMRHNFRTITTALGGNADEGTDDTGATTKSPGTDSGQSNQGAAT